MVVVAIMAILAGIAYPLYTAQSQKARRADARIALENIALAQERHYAKVNSYASSLSSSTLGLAAPLSNETSLEGYYDLELTGGGQSFTATATAGTRQDADTECNKFTMDETGDKQSKTKAGADSACW
jgi:type IV pilus assembly protein PilE